MKTAVLDIETIADRRAMERCGYREEDGVFAPWPLHQIACASVLTVCRVGLDDLAFDLHSFSRGQMHERGIVASVEWAVEDANQIITYNGRAFDIPVLLSRAILTDEDVPTLARLGGRSRPGLHYDLHEQIKGAGGGIKLAHLCAAFSIPAKTGGAGESVARLAAGERWLEIEHYCQTDVLATWLAAQMWDSAENPGFGRGRWKLLSHWLASRPPDNPRLAAFCELPPPYRTEHQSIEVTF